MRSAKAYVNNFLGLPNAMCSHNVYLYWMPVRDEENITKRTGGRKVGGEGRIFEIVIGQSLVNSTS